MSSRQPHLSAVLREFLNSENQCPQRTLMLTALRTVRVGAKEWNAVTIWHSLNAYPSFQSRKKERKEFVSVPCTIAFEIFTWTLDLCPAGSDVSINKTVASSPYSRHSHKYFSMYIVKNLPVVFSVNLKPGAKFIKPSSATCHWTKLLKPDAAYH